MKKILPFCTNPPVKSYSYFADYLGVLMANNYEIDTILESRFLFLNYIPFTGQVNFQKKAKLKKQMNYKSFDIENINILNFVKANICSNKYIVTFLNDYYFNAKLKQNIGVHNWLIYGFDDEKEKIYIAGYIFNNNCGTYETLTISYSELNKSFVRSLSQIEKKRISSNHIFSVYSDNALYNTSKTHFARKIFFNISIIFVLKSLIIHNYIFSYVNFTPYKRDFLDLRDLRIVFEQCNVFTHLLSKKSNKYLNELYELTDSANAMLLQAGLYHYKRIPHMKKNIRKSINKKLKKIISIETKLCKYLFI